MIRLPVAVALAVFFASVGFVRADSALAATAALSERTVNGKSVSSVTLQLKDKSVKPVLLAAKDGFASKSPLASMSGAGGAFAAVGGLPSVSRGGIMLPEGVLIRDGKLIHTGGGLTAAFTGDGRFLLDNVSFELYGYVNGELKAIPWEVNQLIDDRTGIAVFTPEFGAVVPVSGGARAVVVVDGLVSHVASSDFLVPDNGFALLYNSGVVYMVNERFKPGDHVSYDYRVKTGFTSPRDWEGVSAAIGVGADLVIGGEMTAGRYARDSAHAATARADRSFLGASATGALAMGVIRDVSLWDAAEVCKTMGLVNAACMEAGSSGFYFNGANVKSGVDINNSIGFADIDNKGAKAPAMDRMLAKELNMSVGGAVAALRGFNVNGSNYFMLRDVAYLLKDSEHRFGVDWDGASKTISLHKGRNYVPNGSELKTAAMADRTASPGGAALEVGEAVYSLDVYNIDGNNFFKLRDLGGALGFPVEWDAETSTIAIH